MSQEPASARPVGGEARERQIIQEWRRRRRRAMGWTAVCAFLGLIVVSVEELPGYWRVAVVLACLLVGVVIWHAQYRCPECGKMIDIGGPASLNLDPTACPFCHVRLR